MCQIKTHKDKENLQYVTLDMESSKNYVPRSKSAEEVGGKSINYTKVNHGRTLSKGCSLKEGSDFPCVKGRFFLKKLTFILIFQIPARFFARVENLNFPHLSQKVKCVVNSNSLTLQKI